MAIMLRSSSATFVNGYSFEFYCCSAGVLAYAAGHNTELVFLLVVTSNNHVDCEEICERKETQVGNRL